ncbi:hypothetical protein H257_05354 [Aphanomyces astaci]|uniref:Uncharacterized protein n=1 Tax=Aphanomyces astaci TaxID=112090 RepID=W4GPV7_APHAT|nr:hypothetical protein H257_05354 [Aphanomyces astaci]ETV81765.1 hypothetical protein H257_05354 [Aphanomyces astaci]|eukprot:XP_009828502.1 hypothetical protein H257_05354 [Aphanomyces astaci]
MPSGHVTAWERKSPQQYAHCFVSEDSVLACSHEHSRKTEMVAELADASNVETVVQDGICVGQTK